MKISIYTCFLLLFVKTLSAMNAVEVLTPQDIELGSIMLQRSMSVKKEHKVREPLYASFDMMSCMSEPKMNLLKKKVKVFTILIKQNKQLLGEALLFCVQKNFEEAAIFLIGMGAPLDTFNQDHQSIFHLSAKFGRACFYEKLLKDFDLKPKAFWKSVLLALDKNGDTPMAIAAKNDKSDIVDLLCPFYLTF